MQNYWLDKKYNVNDKELTQAVALWKEEKKQGRAGDLIIDIRPGSTYRKLESMFKSLTKKMLLYKPMWDFDDEEVIVANCIRYCFDKIDRYDPCKGKAFNFFVTIILSYLRQIYMSNKGYKKMKECK